jgi:hypothetical protein
MTKYWNALESLSRPAVTKPVRGVLMGATLGALALTALISIRVAFDFVREFQLQAAAKHEAQLAAADGRPESAIRSELLRKATSLGVSLTPEAIHIHATPPPPPEDQADGNILAALGVSTHTTATGHVDISIAYDVPYRYPGGATALHFHFAVSDQDI